MGGAGERSETAWGTPPHKIGTKIPVDKKTAKEYFGGRLTMQEIIDFTQRKEENMNTIQDVLNEREHTHGNFSVTARLSQGIKQIFHGHPTWTRLSHVQSEALDNIASKIARILAGNEYTIDHWKDIQGYAELAIKEIKESGVK